MPSSREIINIQVCSMHSNFSVIEDVAHRRSCNRSGKLATRYVRVLNYAHSSDRFRALLVQVGETFWQRLLAEHGIDNSGVRDALRVVAHNWLTRLVSLRRIAEQILFNFKGWFLSMHLCRIHHLMGRIFQAGVYFDEILDGSTTRYVPRSVQVDLEAGVCNRVSICHNLNFFRSSVAQDTERHSWRSISTRHLPSLGIWGRKQLG